MTEIDTSAPVLVTGATGYVAGWIVKRLLEAGATVHAAVREPANGAETPVPAVAAEDPSGPPARLAELVADRPDGLDQPGVLLAQLGPQASDVDVDRAGAAVVLVAPHP